MVRPLRLSGTLDWRPWITTTIGSGCNAKAIRHYAMTCKCNHVQELSCTEDCNFRLGVSATKATQSTTAR